jgi:hypothetical protein
VHQVTRKILFFENKLSEIFKGGNTWGELRVWTKKNNVFEEGGYHTSYKYIKKNHARWLPNPRLKYTEKNFTEAAIKQRNRTRQFYKDFYNIDI